jgi:hypothetical protein
MKTGFICLNLPGHLNPMTTLALQKAITKANALSVAADLIEESSGMTKKAPLPEEAIHG